MTSSAAHPSAVRVALDFLEAFAAGDGAGLAALLDPDVVFESPRITLHGAEAVTEAIGSFAHAVQALSVIAAYGDEEHAVVMYAMDAGPLGTIRAADHFVVREGRVVADQLVFDTYALRELEKATGTPG